MTYTLPLRVPAANKALFFIAFLLALAAPVSHANSVLFNAIIDYSITLQNDASAAVRIVGVSDGLPFDMLNPSPGTSMPMTQAGDWIDMYIDTLANSGPTSSSADAGLSIVTAILRANIEAGSSSTTELDTAIALINYLIFADGNDAFTTIDTSINSAYISGTQQFDPNGFPVPLAESNATSDTLFDCTLNFVDTGQTSPCTVTDQVSVEWVDLPLVSVPPVPIVFSESKWFSQDIAISSTASSSATLSFVLPAAVPLPPVALLFISGLIGLVGIARRKKAVQAVKVIQ